LKHWLQNFVVLITSNLILSFTLISGMEIMQILLFFGIIFLFFGINLLFSLDESDDMADLIEIKKSKADNINNFITNFASPTNIIFRTKGSI
jgi:hypothetical protein